MNRTSGSAPTRDSENLRKDTGVSNERSGRSPFISDLFHQGSVELGRLTESLMLRLGISEQEANYMIAELSFKLGCALGEQMRDGPRQDQA